MATYEQAIEALRRADAEGNVEDAQRLAEIARRLRPEGAGGGRGLVGGATAEGRARAATSMSEYLRESAKQGLTEPIARLGAGSAMQTGTFAGAFPTQPELEEFTTENLQRRMGVDTDIRPATAAQKYLGAGTRGLLDVTNLIGLPVTTAGKVALGVGSSMAGMGGEFGGEVGKQVGGVPGQITGGILFALASGAGGAKGVGLMADARNKVNLKDFNVEDLAGVEGTSQAKDLIEKAISADPNLKTRLEDIRKKIAFVGGQPDILATGGVDNRILRASLENLASKDTKIASDLEQIYKDLQNAVRAKANELYPTASTEIPKASTQIGKVEIDYTKRLAALADQQAKLTQSLNLAGNISPIDLGKPIQNIVLAQETAARNALKPEYESVISQASKLGAILPADQTQALLNTAKDLFMQDPWGRQSDLLKLVQKQSGEFSKLRKQGQVDTTLPSVPGQPPTDLSIGLDITSLDSLKRRVAADIRTIKNDATKDKLILLQQRVDDALNQVQNSSGNINVNFRGGKSTFGEAMTQLDLDYYNKVGIPFKDADAIQKIGSQEYAERIAPQLANSPTAMTQFLKVAGDEGMPLAEKAVMSKLYNSALDKDGYIDPTKLNSLLTKTSNNGGYSDILDQLPGLKSRLDDATNRANVLSAERVAIDDASKAERIRLGDSFLANYETGGVDAITSRMLGSTGKGYQAKFFSDLKKLSPDDQTNTTLAVQNAMVTKMLDNKNPFAYLEKNKDAFVQLFGKQHYDNLSSLADVQRLATKINVDRLPVDQAAIKEMSALQRLMGGVDPKKVSAILVNQISSVFNKGFRIAAAIGQENIDQATKDAHRRLFMDKGGLDGVIKASTRLINKKGKEVELADFIKPGDLSNLASSMGMSILRTGYLGGTSAISPSEIVAPEPESYYEYTPTAR
jgi:uncharacterized spore protein YtfJ